MKHTKSAKDLLAENEDLRHRLEEALDTLRAIRNGEVDALNLVRTASPARGEYTGSASLAGRWRSPI